jgi:hypothetical protein
VATTRPSRRTVTVTIALDGGLQAADHVGAARAQAGGLGEGPGRDEVHAQGQLLVARRPEVGERPVGTGVQGGEVDGPPAGRVPLRVQVGEAGEVARRDDQVQPAVVEHVVGLDGVAVGAHHGERELAGVGQPVLGDERVPALGHQQAAGRELGVDGGGVVAGPAGLVVGAAGDPDRARRGAQGRPPAEHGGEEQSVGAQLGPGVHEATS